MSRIRRTVERAYSVITVRPSVSVRVRDCISNLRLSFAGDSNLRLSFFRRGHPCPLDTFLFFFHSKLLTFSYFSTKSVYTLWVLIAYVAPDRAFFNIRLLIFFSYFSTKKQKQKKNICCWYSLEAPLWGAPNEYQHHMFFWRNEKNIYMIPPHIWSYADMSEQTCSVGHLTQRLLRVYIVLQLIEPILSTWTGLWYGHVLRFRASMGMVRS